MYSRNGKISRSSNGYLLTIFVLGFVFGCLKPLCNASPDTDKRPVTIADAIRMTRVAGTGYPSAHPKSGFAVFSPDGNQFAFVITRGNPENNTNVYSLLLFRSILGPPDPIPRILTSFSSSSNREGIFNLKWSSDNDTLFFLGSRGDESTQLYSIRCSSGQLTKLTDHPTSLLSYAVSENGKIVYSAEKRAVALINDNTLRHGIIVTTESLPDLITSHTLDYEPEIILNGSGVISSKPLPTQNPFDSGVNDLYPSPDGRYVVVKTDTRNLPKAWKEYEDSSIQSVFRLKLPNGTPSRILRYELIDTQTSTSTVLLNSPTTYAPSDVLWSPDSTSVLLCGTFLPLQTSDPVELRSRQSTKFVVEVSLPLDTVTKITNEDLKPVRWDRHNVVQFRLPQYHNGDSSSEYIYYHKIGTTWERCKPDSDFANEIQPDILAEQDLNTPPQIVAIDPKTSKRRVLAVLNPQFSALSFGKVEQLNWTDNSGHPVTGGLYLPPDFKVGTRYPLVIQTHGFDPKAFSVDGPYSTAFAAQPLASKDIVVLQVNDIFYDSLVTPLEPERAMNAYENAITLLDKQGIIDPTRVGIIGFSRTCLYVQYALTHSQFHFAAAVIADGVDAGYLQYVMSATPKEYNASSEFDVIIGAPPFGSGLLLWLRRSPGFMLDKVQTPLLIQALGAPSLLGEWEWFSGLRRLGKPVDLLYLPTGSHILVQPWQRLASQGRSMDWLCFWLKNDQDPEAAKSEQYRRWREFRDAPGHATH